MLFAQSRQPYSAKSRLSAAIQSLQAKPLAFSENVRDIMWWDGYRDEKLCNLLSICTGVKTLVLWGLNRELADRISSLQLERLTFSLEHHLEPTLSSCVSLTHLRLVGCNRNFNLPWITTLPSLTHLCLDDPRLRDRRWFKALLEAIKLQVCIFRFFHDVCPPGPWIDNDRVVIMPLEAEDSDFIRDWKLGVAGGRDFWVRAEEVLESRRREKSITTQLRSIVSM
ncbi:hypothetical protein DFH06DRAFT_1316578 [Mycena polygramma]|nr:hypothetical protein DFH06DRAFT_1316578 [Mycena polygramma]